MWFSRGLAYAHTAFDADICRLPGLHRFKDTGVHSSLKVILPDAQAACPDSSTVMRQDIVAVPQLLDTDLPRLQKRVATLAAHGRSVELPSQVSFVWLMFGILLDTCMVFFVRGMPY